VLRIDPDSGRTLARIRAPGATSLAATDDAVWLSGGKTGVLYGIDPVANAVVTRVPLDAYLCCVALGGGYVWAMNHRVWKLSSDGHVVSSIPIDGDGANLRWTGRAMWVSEGVSGQETRIDPRDDATRTLRTGGLSLDTAVRGHVATIVTGEAPPDLLAGVPGPAARIVESEGNLQPTDAALASDFVLAGRREQLLDATCARLLTLRSAPPPLGWTAAPEIADLPTSRDGREWTFRMRPGFRFSPPSGAPVTTTSMRSTIERALSPRMGSAAAAPRLLSDLVGLAAFRAGRAQHIRGLRVHGDRLLLALRAPAADLPLRMTSRAFCAVPAGTPASAKRFSTAPIPSAGPYYLAAHYGGVAALIRRNPNYHGPRTTRFAAYLYQLAMPLPAASTASRADKQTSWPAPATSCVPAAPPRAVSPTRPTPASPTGRGSRSPPPTSCDCAPAPGRSPTPAYAMQSRSPSTARPSPPNSTTCPPRPSSPRTSPDGYQRDSPPTLPPAPARSSDDATFRLCSPDAPRAPPARRSPRS
jgi:Bacterial extracellular solute-binding proteins, family 5 Middle